MQYRFKVRWRTHVNIMPSITKKIKYPLAEMKAQAERIKSMLEPHCHKIEIAGSIRRKSKLVGDIEIVCIPKEYEIGLFSSGIAPIINQWKKIKGELPCKYTQRILQNGVKLDLFMVEHGNWGNQFATRTGSAEYSHKVLATQWVKYGFHSKNGYLWRRGKKYEIKTEKELFQLIGLEYIEPEFRNI